MPVEGDYECYSGDWRRTNPDLVLSLPKEPTSYGEHQDHVLVDVTPGGDLLAIWTLSVTESALAVVYARSTDGGVSWTEPQWIDGPRGEPGQDCSFGFPVISKNGRIYCFYNESYGIGEGRINALLRCKYSDDDGHSWIGSDVKTRFRRTKWDHPDPEVLERCIVWQKPVRDAKGRHIVPATRSTASEVRPPLDASHMGAWAPFGECRSEFLRFENIDDEPRPEDVQITFLPDDEDLVEVTISFEPHASQGYSFCQEPGIVLLPDGRLFTEMRTSNGQIWYTVSDDDGHTWRRTEILRYRDGGDFVLNPIAPSPMFRLEDGRYLLFLQNHDGWGYGGRGPLALESRRPQFMAVGEFRPDAHQPVWFSEPMLLFDTQKVGVYPLYMWWLSMYASLTEHNGKRIFWYTDRKVFSLGRYITDEMLAPLTVPS